MLLGTLTFSLLHCWAVMQFAQQNMQSHVQLLA